MLRAIAPVLFILCAGPASAQSCPDFFRFVDFGLEGRDGAIHRGGTIFRAEGFDGQDLLLTEGTVCLSVPEVSKDGPGNPIPVVKSIQYDPKKTEIALLELRVFAVDDPVALAEQTVVAHRAVLGMPDTKVTRGPNFLCADLQETETLSCQFLSPYPGNAPLIVSCDALLCTMPALAINKQLLTSAVWANDGAGAVDAEISGPDILDKIQKVHDFLSPLSSGL